jgi:hypothetical protein
MKTTNELTIRGEQANLQRWLTRVEALLRNGWIRNRVAEERFDRHGGRGPWDCCFSCTATADRPAAGLWVHARGQNELSIATVVSLEKQKLTQEESNRLLAEFQREFVGPAAVEAGVTTEVVQHRSTLEQDLSPEAARRLRAFSASANRADLQPSDRQRWYAFLVRAHQDEASFDPSLLDEWLQLEGWPEDRRRQLIGEYEPARSLLSAYDEEAERR